MVCLSLLLLDWRIAGARGVVLAAIHILAFLLIGPSSHRALFTDHGDLRQRVLRASAFVAIDVAYVWTLLLIAAFVLLRLFVLLLAPAAAVSLVARLIRRSRSNPGRTLPSIF